MSPVSVVADKGVGSRALCERAGRGVVLRELARSVAGSESRPRVQWAISIRIALISSSSRISGVSST